MDSNHYIFASLKSWQNGILMLLAMREATSSSTKGQFVALFVFLVALILFISLLQRIVAQNNAIHKFEGINWISVTILSTLATYMMYILAQDLRNWSDLVFLNGPLELRQAVAIVRIFAIILALYHRLTQYSAVSDVDMVFVRTYLDNLHYKIMHDTQAQKKWQSAIPPEADSR